MLFMMEFLFVPQNAEGLLWLNSVDTSHAISIARRTPCEGKDKKFLAQRLFHKAAF